MIGLYLIFFHWIGVIVTNSIDPTWAPWNHPLLQKSWISFVSETMHSPPYLFWELSLELTRNVPPTWNVELKKRNKIVGRNHIRTEAVHCITLSPCMNGKCNSVIELLTYRVNSYNFERLYILGFNDALHSDNTLFACFNQFSFVLIKWCLSHTP